MPCPSGALLSNEFSFSRHEPEATVLYRVVQDNWETFRVQVETENERSLPSHVIKEFNAYLECGILAHGFLRMKCENCRHEKLVAFSCKRRGFCSSCCGRRMSESAAFWVDHVIPGVPVRQWVMSFPMPLRFWMAKSPKLMTTVLSMVIRAVNGHYRKARSKRLIQPHRRFRVRSSRDEIQTGALTYVQRFGGAVNLNIHFHTLFLEGTYSKNRDGKIEFAPGQAPSAEEIKAVLATIQKRVVRHLKKKGYIKDSPDGGELTASEEVSPDDADQNLILDLQGASIQNKIAMGERQGQPVRKIGSFGEPGELPFIAGHMSASLGGFSLHAAVCMRADQRLELEKLCRYLARPPIAEGRLERSEAGEVIYRFKKKWSDGTRAVVFSPLEFMEKLVALIPPPRIHLARFHGVLAPNANWRSLVVPSTVANPDGLDESGTQGPEAVPPSTRKKRLSWAELLKRVFQIDLTECPDCGGEVKLIAVIMERKVVCKILDHLGLPSEPPRVTPARAPPEGEQLAFY